MPDKRSERITMRKQLTRVLLAVGGATAVMVVAVPAAMASVHSTVTGAPTPVTGVAPWTAVQAPGTTFTLTDTTSAQSITCTVGAATGTVMVVNGLGTGFGTVNSSSFGSGAQPCNGPLGSIGMISQKAGTIAMSNLTSFANGVGTGTISGINEILTLNAPVGICTAEFVGTAGVTYTAATSLLQFTAAGDSLTVA